MKAQLLKFLTAWLMISVLISPVVVVWKIWHDHSDFVNTQRVVQSDSRLLSQSFTSSTATYSQFFSVDSTKQTLQSLSSSVITFAVLGFLLSIPLGFYTGILLNARYRTQRHMTLKQQAAILEKIWQQSIY